MGNQSSKFVEEVQIISDRIINYLFSNNWKYINKCTGECVKGIGNPINIQECYLTCEAKLDNDGNYYCDKPGGCQKGGANAKFLAVGLAKVNAYIQSGCNCSRETFSILLYSSIASNQGFKTAWNGALGLQEVFTITLAAIGNEWHVSQSSTKDVAKKILRESQDHDWQHLILLHRLLYGDQYRNNGELISIPNSYYEHLINVAPCRGFDGRIHSGNSYEWGCIDRLDGEKGCENGCGNYISASNGLPFMFYYNLYNLVNTSYGENDMPISINNLALSDIDKNNYIEKDKKNFMAANTITAHNDYLIDNVFSDGQGRVTFVAGKYIDLLPGFEVKNGATLNAYIDPTISQMTCFNTSEPCISSTRVNPHVGLENNDMIEEGDFVIDISAMMQISPNPSPGKFTLQFLGKSIDNTVEIYNIFGEKIYKSDFTGLQYEMDLSSHPKGIYFIKVQSGENIFTEKLVLQ